MELIGNKRRSHRGPAWKDCRRPMVHLHKVGSPPTAALTNGHRVSACSPPGTESSLLNKVASSFHCRMTCTIRKFLAENFS